MRERSIDRPASMPTPTPMPDATSAAAVVRDEWYQLVLDAQAHAAARPAGVAEHRPKVAVLACSDARVPPSVVFSRPPGELFVVRIAGNTAAATAIASLEYAVVVLGVELVVVLGHTGCGAVAAAIDGTCDGSLAPVVAPICALVAAHPGSEPSEISRLNVATTMRRLVDASPAIGAAVAADRLTLRGAVYDLDSGDLQPVQIAPAQSTPSTSSTLSTSSSPFTSSGPSTSSSPSTPSFQEAS